MAAVLVHGFVQGGAQGARTALEVFWRKVSRAALLSPFQRTPLDVLLGRWTLDNSPVFMAADMMDPSTFTKGDTVSLCLVFESKQEIEDLNNKLSAGGEVFMALDKAPFGWYAVFTDKFGIEWMLQFDGE